LAQRSACVLTEVKDSSRRILRVLLQIASMAGIIGALLWYVGIGPLYNTLRGIKLNFLCVSFLAYFGINLLFTVRLRRVLKREEIKTSFGKTLLAQYAGMLTSDVTPGRSGYVLRARPGTPAMRTEMNNCSARNGASRLLILSFRPHELIKRAR
jgi:uncharacterized membrane protein YbhN (UPF0104 family)